MTRDSDEPGAGGADEAGSAGADAGGATDPRRLRRIRRSYDAVARANQS